MIVWNCYEMIGTGDDMNLYEMRKRKEELVSLQKEKKSSNVEVLSELQNVKSEVERVIKITENAREILDDIDEEFERITALDETDELFLWFAVMLQTTRWMLSPKLKLPHMEDQDLQVAIDDRLTDKEKKHKGNKYQDKSSGRYYEEEKINEWVDFSIVAPDNSVENTLLYKPVDRFSIQTDSYYFNNLINFTKWNKRR